MSGHKQSGQLNRAGSTGDGLRTCAVDYLHANTGERRTSVGYGDNYLSALRHADEQLPAGSGEWSRVCVSQPSSIYADLHAQERTHPGSRGGKRPGEGRTVTR